MTEARMAHIGESCELCLQDGLNVKDGKGEKIYEPDHLEAFTFLAGSGAAGSLADHCKPTVCQSCSAKIRLISSLRAEPKKFSRETHESESIEKEIVKSTSTQDEEFNLDELDNLSLFYAEHDDTQKDPDFALKASKKQNKKVIKKVKLVATDTVSFNHLPTRPNEHTATKNTIPNKLFHCETCTRHFRRKTTLKSHTRICQTLNKDSLHQTGCQICGKDILPSRMAAHRSFEHMCRICDDEYIYANRKEKCQHLEQAHNKWLKKGRVKKSVIPCPKEGCLQTFPKGSKRIDSHLKRDHDESSIESKRRLFECIECHKLYKNSACLRIHMKTGHGSHEDKIKCPFCNFSVVKWRKHSLYR